MRALALTSVLGAVSSASAFEQAILSHADEIAIGPIARVLGPFPMCASPLHARLTFQRHARVAAGSAR